MLLNIHFLCCLCRVSSGFVSGWQWCSRSEILRFSQKSSEVEELHVTRAVRDLMRVSSVKFPWKALKAELSACSAKVLVLIVVRQRISQAWEEGLRLIGFDGDFETREH